MKLENAKAQMRKGILEYCILSIIEKGDVYASDIIHELKRNQILVVEGTLYPLLTRLKNTELIKYQRVESTCGPPRKNYTLADNGLAFKNELSATWKSMYSAVNRITKNKNHE